MGQTWITLTWPPEEQGSSRPFDFTAPGINWLIGAGISSWNTQMSTAALKLYLHLHTVSVRIRGSSGIKPDAQFRVFPRLLTGPSAASNIQTDLPGLFFWPSIWKPSLSSVCSGSRAAVSSSCEWTRSLFFSGFYSLLHLLCLFKTYVHGWKRSRCLKTLVVLWREEEIPRFKVTERLWADRWPHRAICWCRCTHAHLDF